MKKVFRRLLPILVLLVFVFSSLDTFAADAPVLTKEEASSVMRLFWEIRESIGGCFMWFDSPNQSAGLRIFMESELLPQTDYGYWTKCVKTGYGPSEVKELIRDVFSKDYAEEILQDDADFFYGYFRNEETGKWYYSYPLGSQWYHSTPDTEFDFDSLSVISCENQEATVGISGVTYSSGTNNGCVPTTQDFRTTFHFVWEDGKWKMSGGDYAAMLCSVPGDVSVNADSFSKDVALTDITGAIYDVYYFTTLGFNYLITQGLATARINKDVEWEFVIHNKIPNKSIPCHPYYEELEGNIGDPERWLTYARRFCTEEMANQLTDFRGHTSANGRIYYDGDTVDPPNTRLRISRQQDSIRTFSLSNLSAENVTILSSDAEQASIRLDFFVKNERVNSEWRAVILPLRIDFVKESDGWKISGGDFMEKLDEALRVTRVDNPSMGDNLPLLGLAAAALLALPLVRKKRKIAG